VVEEAQVDIVVDKIISAARTAKSAHGKSSSARAKLFASHRGEKHRSGVTQFI
jgi:nitrogen regulatory protein PII